jgi:hypothetical protein
VVVAVEQPGGPWRRTCRPRSIRFSWACMQS